MAKIPLGENLGYQTPQTNRGVNQAPGQTAGFDAIAQLGRMASDVTLQLAQNERQLQISDAVVSAGKEIESYVSDMKLKDRDFSTQDQRYAEFVQELSKKHSDQFKGDQDAFEKWRRNLEGMVHKKGIDVKEFSFAGQIANQRDKVFSQLSRIAELSVQGDQEQFDEARLKGQMLIDEAHATGILSAHERTQANDHYNNQLSRASVKQDIQKDPQAAIDKLADGGYPHLSAEEQVTFRNAALSDIAIAKEKARVASDKASKELVSDTILAYSLGMEVSKAERDAAMSAAAAVNKTEDLIDAQRAAAYIKLPKSARDQLNESVTGVGNSELKQALIKADEKVEAEIARDAYAFGVKQGIVDDVELNIEDPATFQKRMENAEYLTAHYGKPVSPLTDDEAGTLVRGLEMMSPMDKVVLAQTLGPNDAVWKQIDKKNAGLFAMAGAIGDPSVMEPVFKGQDNLKRGLSKAPTAKDYLPVFDDIVGNVYVGADRKAIMEAAIAHYSSTPHEDFNTDEFETSIHAVTGGIGEINGSKVELPKLRIDHPDGGVSFQSVDEGDFEDYIDEFTPDMVKHFGGVWSMSDEEAATMIQDATIVSVGSNQYVVDINGAVLMTPVGDQFQFSYDPDIAKKTAESRQRTYAPRGRQ